LLTLRSGSASLYTGGLKHRVLEVTVHPRYTRFSEDYDVAIIRVIYFVLFEEKKLNVSDLRYETLLKFLLDHPQSLFPNQVANWTREL
jgi:hypothetical protein